MKNNHTDRLISSGRPKIKDKLIFLLDCFTNTKGTNQKFKHHQARLLAAILRFLFFFFVATLTILIIFNPGHDPSAHQYNILISSLITLCIIAYIFNCFGYYNTSAILLITITVFTPWASLLFDHSILQGDFVPLTYLTFSILISSILLPTYVTIALAVLQITGITLVFILSPATPSFNWFSFLTFIILLSVFSTIANSIIQANMKQIKSQSRQLAINEARLQELSIRDYLTNLFNRRYLEETLEREIQRAERTQNPLGVIMMDIDNFKQINDTFGHPTGDIVLKELGKLLAVQIRQSDIACRYGGDEFVLILPDTSRDTTKRRAESIIKKAKSLNIPVSITISLGIAIFPNDGMTSQVILKSADTALYKAKHEGRNRAVMTG